MLKSYITHCAGLLFIDFKSKGKCVLIQSLVVEDHTFSCGVVASC